MKTASALRGMFWSAIVSVGLWVGAEVPLMGDQFTPPQQSISISAAVETDPVPNTGDAADDPAIWVHPSDPALSIILGTDKKGGLAVYDLSGQELQYLEDGRINNVDLRYDFPLGDRREAVVAVSERSDDLLVFYTVDVETRSLLHVTSRPIEIGIGEAYGLCMYHSVRTDEYYVFVNDEDGLVEQWRIFDDGTGQVDAEWVRSFAVGSQTEGCVVDDERGSLYIAEEDVGIWKYAAEPDASATRTLVAAVDEEQLVADVEGLTIYYAAGGGGYLIASSQGSDSFVVYQRDGDNAYVATFEIAAGETVDKVTNTDGIDVVNLALGDAFPGGLFVAQDSDGAEDGRQNFKLVSWAVIAEAAGLTVDTSWEPGQAVVIED